MKTLEYYLSDSLDQLLIEAIELKRNINCEFDKGKLLGYYEIISRLLSQAESFGIIEKVPARVRDFNLESLLEGN